MEKARKPLGYRIWFKVVLTLLFFVPAYTSKVYDPAGISDVIASVLSKPWISSVPVLLPVAKLILLVAVLLPVLFRSFTSKIFIIYYGIVLIPVGILQNMTVTEKYGFVWLIGNTIMQLCVAAYCFYYLAYALSSRKKERISTSRLWLVIPMLIAFLMPYTVDLQGIIRPSLSFSVLWNEAGLTYCMITPVIIGMLLLYPAGVYKPLLSVISYVGLLFGIMNMITWFILRSSDFWMGLLHLPLLILSCYGSIVAHIHKGRSKIDPTLEG